MPDPLNTPKSVLRPRCTVLFPTNDLLWSLPRPPPPLSKQKGAWKSPGVRHSCEGRRRTRRRLPFMWRTNSTVRGRMCPLLRRPRSSALKWLSGRRSNALIQFDCLALHVLSGGGSGANVEEAWLPDSSITVPKMKIIFFNRIARVSFNRHFQGPE